MKKMFLSVIMAIAISTTIKAQSVDSISFKGLVMTLHCHKVMTLICRPQKAGYIDSNQVKATHSYKYTSRTEFHTKSAFEKYTETLSENRVKTSAEVSASIEYGAASANAKAGFETDYFNKLMSTVKNNEENSRDKIDETTEEYQIEYEPHKAIQLYECVLSVPGEYERIYASPKVANQAFSIPYDIVVDYSNAVRTLYRIIKECHVGTDTGEWEVFNNIANTAYTDYSNDKANVWRKFLTALNTKLWTDADDRGSWTIVKNAAGGDPKGEPVDQFRFFCSQVRNIEKPSHNDWAWARITDFAKKYDN